MTSKDDQFAPNTAPLPRSRKLGTTLVVRRPAAAVSLDEDTGYVFRVASLTARVLEELEETPTTALAPNQRACLINARRFLERAERGRSMLENNEAHFVSDIKAVGTYSSARRVLDTLGKNGSSEAYLEETSDVLRRLLEDGDRYSAIAPEKRAAAHEFFDLLSEVFGADVAAETAGFRGAARHTLH